MLCYISAPTCHFKLKVFRIQPRCRIAGMCESPGCYINYVAASKYPKRCRGITIVVTCGRTSREWDSDMPVKQQWNVEILKYWQPEINPTRTKKDAKTRGIFIHRLQRYRNYRASIILIPQWCLEIDARCLFQGAKSDTRSPSLATQTPAYSECAYTSNCAPQTR